MSSRLALQTCVAVLAATPVLVGLQGILSGPEFLHLTQPWPLDLDSHFRFLSGFFLAAGIGWYSCILDIEVKTERFRLLGACTFAGGLARLSSLMIAGVPSTGHMLGLGVELLVVPLLMWWQTRVANSMISTMQTSG